MGRSEFPFVFPLAGNFVDILLHPLGAFALHLICHMAIDVEGEGGSGVAQIPLDGFNVVPAFDRCHGV